MTSVPSTSWSTTRALVSTSESSAAVWTPNRPPLMSWSPPSCDSATQRPPGCNVEGDGLIVNVSSIAAFMPFGSYSAAKAWVVAFTQGLHTSCAGTASARSLRALVWCAPNSTSVRGWTCHERATGCGYSRASRRSGFVRCRRWAKSFDSRLGLPGIRIRYSIPANEGDSSREIRIARCGEAALSSAYSSLSSCARAAATTSGSVSAAVWCSGS